MGQRSVGDAGPWAPRLISSAAVGMLRYGLVGIRGIALLAAGGLAACGPIACGPAAPDAQEASSPDLPEIQIEVEIDLETRPPIDRARLAAGGPDLEDGERRAWDLGPLLGPPYYEAGARLDVIDSAGTSTSFAEPSRRQDGRRPALVLNQKSEWFVELVDPALPDEIHGRGGNRGRPATTTRRMVDVARLRIFTPSGGAARRPADPGPTAVQFRGETIATWTAASLEDLPRLSPPERSRRLSKGAWSLRDLVAGLGEGRRVARVVGPGEEAVEISASDWADPSRTPILRVNQRTELKLEWIEPSGRRAEGPEIRGITRIELVDAAS